jgi:hypothetical protein
LEKYFFVAKNTTISNVYILHHGLEKVEGIALTCAPD